MARKRMIYQKIWASTQFGKLSNNAKLLYIGTITLADDEGRLNGNPAYLRGQIFPYEESLSVQKIREWLEEISIQELIVCYEVEGTEYIKHPNWKKYQSLRKDRFVPSDIPTGNQVATKRQPTGNLGEDRLGEGRLGKDNITTTLTTTEAESASGKEVNLLIESFKDVNPSYEQLFKRKNQREACQRLLKKHGEEKIGRVIAVLPATNAMQYAPVITSPLQLEEKLGKILAFISKEKLKVENKEVRVVKI